MAITFGNKTEFTSASASSVSSITYAHNNDKGDNNTVWVSTALLTGTISGLTYAGNAMTLGVADEGVNKRASMYFIKDATAGSNNVVVTLTGGVQEKFYTSVAQTINGVDQTSPVPTVVAVNDGGPGTAISTNITTTNADNIIYDFVAPLTSSAVSGIVGGGQDELFDTNDAFNSVMGSSKEATDGVDAMAWTINSSQQYDHLLVEIETDGVSVGGGGFKNISNYYYQ